MLQQNSYDSVVGRLEVCYHRLGKNEQETFVYLACFLEGKWSIDLAYISSILKDIGLHPTHGINNLINRSLVNVITEDNRLLVHDQLKHMCWEVLRKKSPDDPGKRMALKSRGDIVDIMTSKKGTEAIRIINDESYGPEVEQCYADPGCFSNMTRLAFLRIKNVLFENGLEYLSNNLRIIEWYECPLKTLPPTFEPKHLFKLEMRGSQIEKLWEKKVIDLPNLRSIDLSFSKNLTEVPDLSMTPCLTKLFLIDCTSLVKIHQSIMSHKKLQFVGLVGCKRLENLGNKSIDMPDLVRINLAGCSNLQTIPEFREQTRNLRYIYLDRTNLKKLPESLGLLQSLSCLSASGTAIKEVPTSFRQLKVLEDLCLEGCRLSSTSPGLLEECNPTGMYWPSHLRVLDFAIPPTRVGDRSAGMNDHKDQSLPKLPRSGTSADYELEYDNNMVKSIVVSCWNCPRLVENESGGGVAVTMLRKYLEVGSIFKDIPQASFEIVAAGSEISQWFSYQGAGNSVTIAQLPSGWYGDEWIGIALCAVIDFCCTEQGNSLAFCPDPLPFDAYIHADGREIRIPLPVHITKCKFENQIVRYLSVNNYLRQSVDWSAIHQFHISFDAPAEEWEVTSCAARMIWNTDLDE